MCQTMLMCQTIDRQDMCQTCWAVGWRLHWTRDTWSGLRDATHDTPLTRPSTADHTAMMSLTTIHPITTHQLAINNTLTKWFYKHLLKDCLDKIQSKVPSPICTILVVTQQGPENFTASRHLQETIPWLNLHRVMEVSANYKVCWLSTSALL